MKLIEGIKYEGKPFLIPDCSRDELPEFFKEMGYTVGAEIGSHKGIYTEKFCKVGLKMYAVDPWKAYTGSGRTSNDQTIQDAIYADAKERLSPYDCTLIKRESMDAVGGFRNESLDFVYIDGDHNFRHIAEDLYEWSWKVRPGGIVSGHDYYHTPSFARNVVCHVGPIVDAYVKIYDIKNFYIFGTMKTKERKNQDRYLSWMWIKP